MAQTRKEIAAPLNFFRSLLGIDFVSYTEGVDTTTPTGQLLFHIVGAVAQFERDLIAERVRAGLAHAKAMGKHIGRPRAKVDLQALCNLRSKGNSLRVIASTLGVPISRVRRALAQAGGSSTAGR